MECTDPLEAALLRARTAISKAQDLATAARQHRQSLLPATDGDLDPAVCQSRDDDPRDSSVRTHIDLQSDCLSSQAAEGGSLSKTCADGITQASGSTGDALLHEGSVDALTDTLAFLQNQQVSTLKRMHRLRTEQLQLRDHQLTLLQSLLQTEGLRMRYSSLQVSALSCVSALTAQALRALKKAIDLLLQVARGDLTEQSASLVSSLCLATDEQAEQVAGIARNVLVLVQASSSELSPGVASRPCIPAATEAQLASLCPMTLQAGATPGHEQRQEDCPICLATFKAGDQMASLQCGHWHHHACLHSWLKVQALCPICKVMLPGVPGAELGRLS